MFAACVAALCRAFSLFFSHASTVREAMVSIMLADGLPQYGHHHDGMAPSPFQRSPWHEQRLVGEVLYDTEQSTDCGMNAGEGCWNNTPAAESGTRILPRDSSTCLLWSAVALGALVRGCPFSQVPSCLEPPELLLCLIATCRSCACTAIHLSLIHI